MLPWKKGLCRYDSVKDLERGSLSWIMQVGSKYNHTERGDTEENTQKRGKDTEKRKRQCNCRGRDWSDVATSQGRRKKQKNGVTRK